MKKISVLLLGLLMIVPMSAVQAQDQPAPAPAPAVAPAPEPAPAPAPAPVAAPAPAPEKKIDWYGMAQYRLRYDITSNKDSAGTKYAANNYSNKVAYQLGVKVKVNDQVNAQVEIGDMWYGTETVTGAPPAPVGILFTLAYAKWNPGMFYLVAGKQPVPGTALMDLIGTSCASNNYTYAAHIPWGVRNNFAVTGLKAGAPIIKGDLKVDVSLLTTIINERTVALKVDSTFQNNPSALLNIIDIPVSLQSMNLTLTPQLVMIMNRNFRDDVDTVTTPTVQDGSDMELGFGLDAVYKLNDMLSFRGGFGMASYSNTNTWIASDTSAGIRKYGQSGMELFVGATAKIGPGKAMLDFNFSTDENTEKDKSASSYTFVDAKYGWGVNKNFTIMPRVRVFMASFDNYETVTAAQPYKNTSKMTMWPELMFIGNF